METIKELEKEFTQENLIKIKQLKEVLELLDSKTIECTMRYGKWWIKLEELKVRIKGK